MNLSSNIFSFDSPFYPIHITINVIVTTFLAVLAAVSTMIASSAIQGELALSDTDSIWISTLNLLGINTIVPTGNWFANRFGYNRTYAAGIAIFTLASFLAAISSDFSMIAIARFVEGIGAGFIFPVGLALIVKSVSKERVGMVINLYIGCAFGLGLSLGIYLSGLLTQFASWRYIFALIVPLGLIATLSCWACRKKNFVKSKTPFDYFGFLTFATFIASLLIALTLGPIKSSDQGWLEPYVIACFGIAFFSLLLCIWIEKNHPFPLIPISLFKDPIFSLSLIAIFLLGIATFGSLSVTILYMLKGLFYERFSIGKIAMIYGLTIGGVSMIANILTKWIPLPLLTFSGLFLLSCSYFLSNELSWLTGYSQLLPILFIRGLGIGLSLGPTTQLALRSISQELKSPAATILTFFRQVGGTYGGTLIAIISIKRTIFHTARFSERVNEMLPAYKSTFSRLFTKIPDPALAKASIIKNIETQSYIQGLNDALFVLGILTSIITLLLIAFVSYQSVKKKTQDKKTLA